MRRPAPAPATTTLNIRDIDTRAARRIKAAAAARGLTIGAYLARLVALHDVVRGLADTGDHDVLAAELATLGLATVTT